MIRKYDDDSKKWEVLGSGNANSIQLDNPEFATETGDPITVSKGFSQVSEKLDTIEKNISYIYKNGTIGGGGGGGGGGVGSSDVITVTDEGITISGNKNFLYIGSDSTTVTFYVKTAGTTSKYYITAKLDSKVLPGWDSTSVYSSKNGTTAQTISLTGIKENATLVISAVDGNGVELESYTLFIRVGSYSFTMEGYTNIFTTYYNDIDSQNFRFYIKNAIPGSTAYLTVKCNAVNAYTEGVSYLDASSWDRTLYFGDLLRGANITNPEIGAEYKISASIEIQSSSLPVPIVSEPIEFAVFIADSSALTIVVFGNYLYSTTTSEEDIKGQPQDDNISASIKIIDSSYSSFKLAYQLVDGNNVIHTVGDWDNYASDENDTILAGYTKTRTFNPIQLGMATGFYTLTVKAWASSYGSYTATKTVRGKLLESENVWVTDYNPNQRMICQYNTYSAQKNPLDTLWKCTQTDNNKPFYPQTGITDNLGLADSRTLQIFGTNGQTSGFLTSDLTSGAPALRLSGKSYGMIDFSPFGDSGNKTGNGYTMGKLQSNNGFVISITFKSDVHPNSNGTILDIGDYSEKTLSSGLHVGLNEVTFKFRDRGNVQNISTSIIQNELNTIDLVYEIEGSGANRTAGVKLYHNGVCSAAYFFNDINDVSINAESRIWFGSRNTRAGASTVADMNDNFCDVNIYDFKMYVTSLNAYGIVRNYINSKARASLISNNLDWSLIKSLRQNNFLVVTKNPDGEDTLACDLCDANNEFDETWVGLYDQLKAKSDNPIPILLITVTSAGFYQTYHKKYSTAEIENMTFVGFNASFTYTDTNGQSVVVNTTSEQVPGTTSSSPYVTLQGTTTMGYSAKNLEMYMGTVDGTNDRLFTPKKDSWLPENRFTLKADVVDSAHCNNASIGKFMNESGVFQNIPPQELGSNKYANKVKHTLEGFPVYLFIQYSSDDIEAVAALGDLINTPQFMGIYSFNLGRGSFFNMGFKVLSDYTLSNSDTTRVDVPSLVSTYTVATDPYQGGCFSYEFNQNNNEYGSFQQDDTDLINLFIDKKYPTETTSTDNYGFNSLRFLFTILANCYEGDRSQKYTAIKNENGEVVPQPLPGEYYEDASTYYTATYVINKKFHWKNANSYFLLAMALGMVDSLGKNMTLRTWNSNSEDNGVGLWYTCFYDMDTCLGLNNYGAQIIGKNVSIDKYENVNTSGYTAIQVTENYGGFGSSGYSTYNSRLWNVVTKGILAKDGNIENGEDGSFRTLWIEWRKNDKIFSTYSNFTENYYKSQIAGIGEIMFNLDYKIKYFNPYNTFIVDESGETVRKDTESIGFLHGRRIEYVTDWLKDRLRFLDAIFLYNYSKKSEAAINDSQYLTKIQLRGSGQAGVPSIRLGITAAAPNIFEYTVNNSTTRAMLEEDTSTDVFIPMADGDTSVTINLKDIISSIDNFSAAYWSSLTGLYLTNLEGLDLADMDSLSDDTSLGTTSSSPFTVMTELRELNLNNMNVRKYSSGVPIVCTNCTKLREIDVSNSDVSSINLPNGGCLEKLLVSGSKISELTITSQPFLSILDFTNCVYLSKVYISDCSSITSLNFDNTSVQSIQIVGCANLVSLSARNCTSLSMVKIDTCQSLTSIDLEGSSISLDNSDAVTLNFLGARALQTLNLKNVNSTGILVSGEIKNTLQKIDISESSIYKIQFDTTPPLEIDNYPITDFSGFKNLKDTSSLSLNKNTKIKYLRFRNNQSEYFNIATSAFLTGCSNLVRVFGHLCLSASGVFQGTSSKTNFYLNNPNSYSNADINCKLSPANGNNETAMEAFGKVWIDDTDSPDGYSTNLTINTANLSNAFYQTSINEYDLYYILSRCKKLDGFPYSKVNVTNLNGTFFGCTSIVTSSEKPLGRYTFKYCTYVTSMNSVLYGANNIKGPLFSPTIAFSPSGKYDGLMSPLVNVVAFGTAFYDGGSEFMDSYFYYKVSNTETLKIKTMTACTGTGTTLSVRQAGVDNTPAPLKSSVFLNYLPALESTSYLFGSGGSNITFEFETVEDLVTNKEVTLFLHNCPNVKTVNNTFPRQGSGYGNNYKITGRITAGLFGGSCNGSVTFTDDTSESGTTTYSNFPSRITNFSFFLCSYNSGSTVKLDWDGFNDFFAYQDKTKITTLESMWGYLSSANYITKGIKKDGSHNSEFPTEVFKGLTALTSVSAFFSNHGIKNSENYPTELPGDIFSDNKNLTDISYVFANTEVPYDFFVKLNALGFRDCKLSNVSHSFRRLGRFSNTTLTSYSGIPLRFFYMDYDSDPIKVYHPDDISEIKRDTFTRKVVRNTITAADYVFYGNDTMGSNQIQYEVNDGGFILDQAGKCGDLIWYNYNYDPRKYILFNEKLDYNEQTNPYIDNPNYSPLEFAWDEWASDGQYRSGFEPTSITDTGAVYIDPSNPVDSFTKEELLDLKTYSYKVYFENENVTETIDFSQLFDSDKSTSITLPVDNYLVFDFGDHGVDVESMVLWNDGVNMSTSEVISVYGEITGDAIFSGEIDLSNLVNIATTSDTVGGNVVENNWITTDGTSGHMKIGAIGKYRYLVLYNGTETSHISQMDITAIVTHSNIVNEVVKKYGPLPSSMNTEDDKKFISGYISDEIGVIIGSSDNGVRKYGTIFRNFLFPSDVFRYCNPSCSVKYAFGYIGGNTSLTENPMRKSLLRGRLQDQLLSTLTNTTSFEGLFANCNYMITQYIPYYREGSSYYYGSMFPNDLFKNNTKVSDIKHIFTYLHVPYNIKLPTNLFGGMGTSLTDISYAFYYGKWGGGDSGSFDQLGTPFGKNSSIRLAKNTWQGGDIGTGFTTILAITDGTNHSLRYVNSNLFTSKTHRSLENVEYMMVMNTSLTGTTTLPTLWYFGTILAKTGCYDKCYSGSNKPSNYDTAISYGYASGNV